MENSKKKDLAKIALAAFMLSASLPAAGNAAFDAETQGTYLAGGCNAHAGCNAAQSRRQPATSSCNASQGRHAPATSSCNASQGRYAPATSSCNASSYSSSPAYGSSSSSPASGSSNATSTLNRTQQGQESYNHQPRSGQEQYKGMQRQQQNPNSYYNKPRGPGQGSVAFETQPENNVPNEVNNDRSYQQGQQGSSSYGDQAGDENSMPQD